MMILVGLFSSRIFRVLRWEKKTLATIKSRFNVITRIFRIADETKNYQLYEKYSALVLFLNYQFEYDEFENVLSEEEMKKFVLKKKWKSAYFATRHRRGPLRVGARAHRHARRCLPHEAPPLHGARGHARHAARVRPRRPAALPGGGGATPAPGARHRRGRRRRRQQPAVSAGGGHGGGPRCLICSGGGPAVAMVSAEARAVTRWAAAWPARLSRFVFNESDLMEWFKLSGMGRLRTFEFLVSGGTVDAKLTRIEVSSCIARSACAHSTAQQVRSKRNAAFWDLIADPPGLTCSAAWISSWAQARCAPSQVQPPLLSRSGLQLARARFTCIEWVFKLVLLPTRIPPRHTVTACVARCTSSAASVSRASAACARGQQWASGVAAARRHDGARVRIAVCWANSGHGPSLPGSDSSWNIGRASESTANPWPWARPGPSHPEPAEREADTARANGQASGRPVGPSTGKASYFFGGQRDGVVPSRLARAGFRVHLSSWTTMPACSASTCQKRYLEFPIRRKESGSCGVTSNLKSQV